MTLSDGRELALGVMLITALAATYVVALAVSRMPAGAARSSVSPLRRTRRD